jgi:hypothetical protein
MLVNSNNDLIVASHSESPISGNKTEASVDNDLWMLELETTTSLVLETIMSNKFEVNPYPNPFTNSVTFDFSKVNDDLSFHVYTLDGKQIFEKNLYGLTTFTWEDNTISKQVLYYEVIGAKTFHSGKIVKD